MKKMLLAALVMLTLAMPTFAMDFATEYGVGMVDSIMIKAPLGGDLSLNVGLDYKAFNTIIETNWNNIKTNAHGTVYMPLIGLDYKVLKKAELKKFKSEGGLLQGNSYALEQEETGELL